MLDIACMLQILSASGASVNDDEENVDSLCKVTPFTNVLSFINVLLAQQSCDVQQLSECCHSCQGCFLLLLLKQHLKRCYGLTDRYIII